MTDLVKDKMYFTLLHYETTLMQSQTQTLTLYNMAAV